MNKEEAIEKLIDYLKSIEVDKSFYNSQSYRAMIEYEIERQTKKNKLENPKGKQYSSFKIGEDEQGVFISYKEYLGYYCYDFAFYFRIPFHPEDKPSIEIWTHDNEYGTKRKIYGWNDPNMTYDITSLVMKTSQMPYMNWKRPPF